MYLTNNTFTFVIKSTAYMQLIASSLPPACTGLGLIREVIRGCDALNCLTLMKTQMVSKCESSNKMCCLNLFAPIFQTLLCSLLMDRLLIQHEAGKLLVNLTLNIIQMLVLFSNTDSADVMLRGVCFTVFELKQ